MKTNKDLSRNNERLLIDLKSNAKHQEEVIVRHYRNVINKNDYFLSPDKLLKVKNSVFNDLAPPDYLDKGITVVGITKDNKFKGTFSVCSKGDNFVKAIGLNLALERHKKLLEGSLEKDLIIECNKDNIGVELAKNKLISRIYPYVSIYD